MQPLPYGICLTADEPVHSPGSSVSHRLLRQVIWLVVAAVFITADWLVISRKKSHRHMSDSQPRR